MYQHETGVVVYFYLGAKHLNKNFTAIQKSSSISQLASLSVVTVCQPPPALHPQHPFQNIRAFVHKIRVWMETMEMTCNRSSDSPPQPPQDWEKLQQTVAAPQCFPPLVSKSRIPLWFWRSGPWSLLHYKMLVFSEINATASLNNSGELNLEVFILDIYLAYEHRPVTCQPY